MAVRLRWQVRHTFWAIITVIVAAVLLWRSWQTPPPAQPLANTPPGANNDSGHTVVELSGSGYPARSRFGGPYAVARTAVEVGRPVVWLTVDGTERRVVVPGALLTDEDGEAVRERLATFLREWTGMHPELLLLEDASATADGAWLAAPGPADDDPGYDLLHEQILGAGLARFDDDLPAEAPFRLTAMAYALQAHNQQLGLWAGE